MWADITRGFQDLSNTLTGGQLSPQMMMALTGAGLLLLVAMAKKKRDYA